MQKPRVITTGTAILAKRENFQNLLIPNKRSVLLMVKAESAIRLRPNRRKLEVGALTLL
jgi:hypothetical protein